MPALLAQDLYNGDCWDLTWGGGGGGGVSVVTRLLLGRIFPMVGRTCQCTEYC